MIQAVVLGQPVPQGSNRAINGRVMASNAIYLKPWRQAVGVALVEASLGHRFGVQPVIVHARFYFRRPASHFGSGRNVNEVKASAPAFPTSRTCGDLDKLARAIGDALTDVGIVEDDSQIVRWVADKRWCASDQGLLSPGATIEVKEAKL